MLAFSHLHLWPPSWITIWPPYIVLSIVKGRFRSLRQPKTLNRLRWNLAWLTMSCTPPNTTILVRVALRGWSGHMRDVSEFLLFLLFLLFLHTSSLYFFTYLYGLYAKTDFCGYICALWDYKQCMTVYLTTFSGHILKKLPQLAGMEILKPERQQ